MLYTIYGLTAGVVFGWCAGQIELPHAPRFISHKRRGGIHFTRIGRLTLSWSIKGVR